MPGPGCTHSRGGDPQRSWPGEQASLSQEAGWRPVTSGWQQGHLLVPLPSSPGARPTLCPLRVPGTYSGTARVQHPGGGLVPRLRLSIPMSPHWQREGLGDPRVAVRSREGQEEAEEESSADFWNLSEGRTSPSMAESPVQGLQVLPASPNSRPCPWGLQAACGPQNDREEEMTRVSERPWGTQAWVLSLDMREDVFRLR